MNLSAEQKSEQTLFKKTKSFFTFQFRKRKVRSHPRIPFGLALRYSLRLQNGYAASATLFAETAYVQMRCWICFNSNQKKKKKNQDHFFDTWKNFRQFFFFFFFLLPKSEIFDEFSAWTVQEKPVVRSIKEGEQTLFFFFPLLSPGAANLVLLRPTTRTLQIVGATRHCYSIWSLQSAKQTIKFASHFVSFCISPIHHDCAQTKSLACPRVLFPAKCGAKAARKTRRNKDCFRILLATLRVCHERHEHSDPIQDDRMQAKNKKERAPVKKEKKEGKKRGKHFFLHSTLDKY